MANHRRKSLNALERTFSNRSWAPKCSKKVNAMLNSAAWSVIVMVATVWSLFSTDLRVSCVPMDYDTLFEGFMMACFVFFCMEFLLACIFVPKYIFSFWFYLDIFATLTMILDIQMLASSLPDSLTGNGSESQSLQSARAGRAARVGARAGRLSRFLRLIRIAKLIKVGAKRSNSVTAEREALNEMKPTVIGGLFTEITTRKVVLIILAVLITSSFISVDDFDGNRFTGIVFVENYTLSPPAFIATSAFRIEYMGIVHTNSNTLAVYVPVTQMALNDLRDNEILKITGSCSYGSLGTVICSSVWYNIQSIKKDEANANLILTSVVLVILAMSMYAFGRDSHMYIVKPIHNMMTSLHGTLEEAKDEDDKDGEDDDDDDDDESETLETTILQSSVKKLVEAIDMSRRDAMKQKSIADSLLYSMVPKTIAKQLKAWRWWESPSDKVIADAFSEVTILFTDIVGFTRLSARISAEEVVAHLNNMYSMFDAITEKHGLYKVETIGDCYMLVGGAPDYFEDHAERVCAAALEFKACVPRLREISGEPSIDVRIGMHSGPIVAGVVGYKNPRYHLFGDCVNTASRMESTGIAGQVQLSEDTYELVRHRFRCQKRGALELKGKGSMDTYMLLGRIDDNTNIQEVDFKAAERDGNPQLDKMKEVVKSRRRSLMLKEEDLIKFSAGIAASRADEVYKKRSDDEREFFSEFDALTLFEQKEVVRLLLDERARRESATTTPIKGKEGAGEYGDRRR